MTENRVVTEYCIKLLGTNGDLLRGLPGGGVRGLGQRPQQSALVERDGERHGRLRVHRVQVDACDLHRILVKRDVANEVLGQGRVL